MSIFSSFLVLLLILVETAPSSASSVPKLGIYYCFNMVIIMMSIFLSSMVVNIHRAGDGSRILPKWMKMLMLQLLGRILCICPAPCTGMAQKPSYYKDATEAEAKNLTESHSVSSRDTDVEHNDAIPVFHDALLSTNGNYKERLKFVEKWFSRVELQICSVRRSLGQLVNNIEIKRKEETCRKSVAQEWKLVAKVLDRFFVILYLVTIFVSIVILFPKPLFLRMW